MLSACLPYPASHLLSPPDFSPFGKSEVHASLSVCVFTDTFTGSLQSQDKASSFGLVEEQREYGCFSVISCTVLTADFFQSVCAHVCWGLFNKEFVWGLFWGSRVINVLLIASGNCRLTSLSSPECKKNVPWTSVKLPSTLSVQGA